ncbi:MAG: hypothetical protein GX810_06280, partial [Clostridiales bacterium]|nr:hypothetical protein [Clostridiales bacterium]
MRRLLCLLTCLALVTGVGAGAVTARAELEETPTPSVTITLDKTTVAVGESITASWIANNAPADWTTNASWTVWYEDYGDGQHGANNVTQSSFTPQSGYSGSIDVWFVDANGAFVAQGGSADFTIEGWTPSPTQPPIPKDVQFTISLDRETVEVGQPITATW